MQWLFRGYYFAVPLFFHWLAVLSPKGGKLWPITALAFRYLFINLK